MSPEDKNALSQEVKKLEKRVDSLPSEEQVDLGRRIIEEEIK
jgi:hypothetical protein